MKIEVGEWKISEIIEGYENKKDGTVTGLGGLLNIRPSYQREFVYDLPKQRAVIDTILKGYPLNSMYWVNNEDDSGEYEVLDGQQRILSFCEFIKGNNGKGGFAITDSDGMQKRFPDLSHEKQKRILNYGVVVNVCTGIEDEKMNWFKTINIAGEKLTTQEIRNAIYSGPWVTDAKKRFSKRGCPAETTYKKFLSGDAIRQDYLETAIWWACELKDENSHRDKEKRIEEYMSSHKKYESAEKLYQTFADILNWANLTFLEYHKEMKGLDWGKLYKEYGSKKYNGDEVKNLVDTLMKNEEITEKKGIFEYVLSGCDKSKEKLLNIRIFPDYMKKTAYEKQNGYCKICGKSISYEECQADHIIPWSKGGQTIPENCQVLCRDCNYDKSNK